MRVWRRIKASFKKRRPSGMKEAETCRLKSLGESNLALTEDQRNKADGKQERWTLQRAWLKKVYFFTH